jgi:two-component system response regulator YesN
MTKHEILLLGDGSHPFRTMDWALESRGFSVKALESPEAALEALVKKNYDLVIAKLSRVERDNLTVLRQAQKINPLIKVILITDSLDLAFPLEAYNIDIDDYIIMPVSANEFSRRVKNCLEGLVVDLAPENFSQSAAEEKLTYNPLACDPLVSAIVPEIITAF